MVHIAFYWLALSLCVGFAAMAGGGPERIAAGSLLIASIVTIFVQSGWFKSDFTVLEHGVFVVDVALFVVVMIVAIFANRIWPLCLAALTIVQVLVHIAKITSPTIAPFAYAMVLALWGYPMITTIALGTANHRRRMSRFGGDKSWSPSFDRWLGRMRNMLPRR